MMKKLHVDRSTHAITRILAPAALLTGLAGTALAGFNAPILTTTEASTTEIAVGNLNGDANVDLLVANQNSQNVSTFFGDGDGTFSGKTEYATSAGTVQAVAIGAINSGLPEILAANFGIGELMNIGFNDGAGDFTNFQSFSVDLGANDVIVASVNDDVDSHPDVVVVNQNADNVTILLGNGLGGFTGSNVSVGNRPTKVAAGDFDGDGNVDLAVTNNDNVGTLDEVLVLTGNGDGTFDAPVSVNIGGDGTNPSGIVAGDFDGDGELDLAVATNNASGTVVVLIGTGTGTFAAPVAHSVGSLPFQLAAGDLDGNGTLDIVTSNFSSNDISILRNTGSTFDTALPIAMGAATNPFGVALGDMNGDGDLDIVVGLRGSSQVAVLLNDGGQVPVDLSEVEID